LAERKITTRNCLAIRVEICNVLLIFAEKEEKT
jgi:hypothetical protein